MPNIYNNWERLVAAVLKREEIWELCHAPSCSSFSSISTDLSSISSSRFDDFIYGDPLVKGRSGREIVGEWVDIYKPGVYVLLGDFRDGTRTLILVGFSKKRFKVRQAQDWWHACKEDVHLNYIPKARPSKLKETYDLIEVECIEEHATRVHLRQSGQRLFVEYDRMPKLAIVENPILEPNFNEVLTSANEGVFPHCENELMETVERFGPGIYVSLDELADVERVRFSRNIFNPHEALAWWVKNREGIYRNRR